DGIGLDVAIWNSLKIIVSERNEGVGDEARLRGVRIVIGVTVGDAAEIVERLEIVLRHAIAFRIHAAEFPLRERMTVFRSIFKRVDRLDGFAGLEPVRAGTERLHRRHWRRAPRAAGPSATKRI